MAQKAYFGNDVLQVKMVIGVVCKIAEKAFAVAAPVGHLQKGAFGLEGGTVNLGIVIKKEQVYY